MEKRALGSPVLLSWFSLVLFISQRGRGRKRPSKDIFLSRFFTSNRRISGAPRGRPSLVTEPCRVAVVPKVMVWSVRR